MNSSLSVIILDFDGVLVTAHPHPRTYADPSCVAQLNQLTDETGAKIVVSSTWRLGGQLFVTEALQQFGVTGEVIGLTPDLSRRQIATYKGLERGEEIIAWLRDHPEVERFVIIDDDNDMGTLLPFLAQTDYRDGLTAGVRQQAQTILQERTSPWYIKPI